MTVSAASPPVWFRLPPGFHDLSPNDRAALIEITEALGAPNAQRGLGRLMDGLEELGDHHVVHTAIGLHPDVPDGVCTSLFSLAIRPVAADLLPSLGRTALAIADSSLWIKRARRLLELPSTLPCYLIAGTIALPGTGQQLFQARAATAHADGRHILVLDLTSAATHQADAYSDIIEAIAHTVAFTDPDPGPTVAPKTSRILEVLL
ncbi:hypothetical protein L1606_33465 [Streptomyces spororaveus]|uniref:hypothetical protein n=1 Tax=Streptomyces spororaveus TaxID=284039 RepID=UPI00207ACF2B|nr:hypothetical protein [Streptomyces spororaveus]MCM9082939.1 hypothetical protein [Streptomyces spororaveus]